MRRSLAVEHDQTGVLYLLSVGLIARGDYHEAVGLLRQVLKKEPASGRAQYHLARALQALGRQREAKAALQHACTLEPNLREYAEEDSLLASRNGKGIGVVSTNPPDARTRRESLRLAAAPAPEFSVGDVLEKAATQQSVFRTLTCDLHWTERDKVNVSKRERRGTATIVNGVPNPRFFCEFTHVETDGVLGKREWYMFDGVLLWAVSERAERITLRKLSDGIAHVDFFNEGVLPVPLTFDLDPARIYRHFAIFGLGPEKDDPPDTYHLVLFPKSGTRFRRGFDQMDVFVSRTLSVPIKVIVQSANGLVTEQYELREVELDAQSFVVAADLFAPHPDWKAYEQVLVSSSAGP